MLVHDTSGSMQATDVKPDRLSAARDAARTLISSVRRSSGSASSRSTPRSRSSPRRRPTARRRSARSRAQGPGRHRDGRRPAAAVNAIRTPVTGATGAAADPGAIVLLSDGASTSGRDPRASPRRRRSTRSRSRDRAGHAERQAQAGRRQHDAVPPDTATLDSIARTSGGARSPRRRRATSRRSTRTSARAWRPATRSRRSRSAFAGGALILLLAGMVTGLIRNGRLREGAPATAGARADRGPAGSRARPRRGPALARPRGDAPDPVARARGAHDAAGRRRHRAGADPPLPAGRRRPLHRLERDRAYARAARARARRRARA